jgi:hypothetical protein
VPTLGCRAFAAWLTSLFLFVILLLLPVPVLACLVCINLPERTIADRVIEAETVVPARGNPDRPFS